MAEALQVQHGDDGGVRITLHGDLDVASAPVVWDQVVRDAGAATGPIIVDVADVEACDGIGVGVLAEVTRAARERSISIEIVGASDELSELLSMASDSPPRGDEPTAPPGAIEQVGASASSVISTLLQFIGFVGELTAAAPLAIATLTRARLAEYFRQFIRVGADAVPVVSLLGCLVGYILSVQAVKALQGVGGVSLVPMIVGFATVREFAPLIAAIIVAGRSGSAFAAEIGTMKVTEELDAYTTLSLNPMVVLVLPRVMAGLIVMPLLTVYSMVLAVGGGFVPMIFESYSASAYFNGVIQSIAPIDLVQALVKGAVFGLIVACLGCFHGLRTGFGADAVGTSPTRAVVSGIVAVLVADSVVSSIFYTLQL